MPGVAGKVDRQLNVAVLQEVYGLIRTNNLVVKGVDARTPPDSLRRAVRESVHESRDGLLRILNADPRLELFAGVTGTALRSEFLAAAERVAHIGEVTRWPE